MYRKISSSINLLSKVWGQNHGYHTEARKILHDVLITEFSYSFCRSQKSAFCGHFSKVESRVYAKKNLRTNGSVALKNRNSRESNGV